MLTRTHVLAGAATIALTAGSIAAVAATGTPVHTNAYGMDRVAVSTCGLPASLPGQRVTVMLGDMGGSGGMMGGTGGMMGGSGSYGGMMGGSDNYSSMMGGRTMMLYAQPQTVRAGQVSLIAINRGTRTHELVVLPLTDGASAGTRVVGSDNKVSETGSLGEASNSCGSGTGAGIRAGSSSWLTMTLKPGRYELVCNLPRHYAAGMYTELDVV